MVKHSVFLCRGCCCIPDFWLLPEISTVIFQWWHSHCIGCCPFLLLADWVHWTFDTPGAVCRASLLLRLLGVLLLWLQFSQQTPTTSLWPLKIICVMCPACRTIYIVMKVLWFQRLFNNWLMQKADLVNHWDNECSGSSTFSTICKELSIVECWKVHKIDWKKVLTTAQKAVSYLVTWMWLTPKRIISSQLPPA